MSDPAMRIGKRLVGRGHPCLVVAELGANHNGDLATCLRMIEAAQRAGADVVKLQKRDPSMECVPEAQRSAMKDTPWGAMTYADYRRRLEFDRADYDAIDRACRQLGIPWTASAWDVPSVDFLGRCGVPFLKIPSACITDRALLARVRFTHLPIVMSTGMSTVDQIDAAVDALAERQLALLWCRSTYPSRAEDMNLAAIHGLAIRYPHVPIGFSDHFSGIWLSLCAAAMGACIIERHFTLDRAMWGTDQAASTEPSKFAWLVSKIRQFEQARGDGVLGPILAELEVARRLRRVP